LLQAFFRVTRRIGRAQRNGAMSDNPKEIKMGTINFEDVYANAYVRESVESLVATTIRQYPMLVNYEDDIRQELWIAINNHLQLFIPAKSSLDTFFRLVLENALKDIRRGFFSNKSIFCRNASDLDLCESRMEPQTDDVNRAMLIADVRAVIKTLDPIRKSICELLMDGYTMREIAAYHKISVGILYKKYLTPIKKIFIQAGIKK
jgi:RNA polymerase sigma factor (sigma-70 family)